MSLIHLSIGGIHRLKSNMVHLFLSAVGRRIAMTLLYLFSSIYIFESIRAFGVKEVLAIVLVVVYYLLVVIVKLITLFVSEDLSQKIGFKRVIWLSGIPFIAFVPSLILVGTFPYLLILSAVLWGAHAGLFWWGYHGYFIKSEDPDHYGEGVGKADFFETTAIVLTPILGSAVASFFGFKAVFILSGIIMVLALFLLGRDHERRQKRDVEPKEVMTLVKSHKSISLAYVGSAANLALYYVFWPMFLFFFFGQVLSLGLVVSAAAFLAALFAIVIGNQVDKQGERKIIKLGTPVVIFSWIFRIFSKSVPSFIFADSLWNFGQRMVVLPLNILSYKKALEGPSARAVLFKETASSVGVMLGYIVSGILIYLTGSLRSIFVAAAFFAFLPLVSVVKKRLPQK